MDRTYNIYCDESCHLEHDCQKAMVLGGIWCSYDNKKKIARQLRALKIKYRLSPKFEVKWNKVSPARADFYLALVDFFSIIPICISGHSSYRTKVNCTTRHSVRRMMSSITNVISVFWRHCLNPEIRIIFILTSKIPKESPKYRDFMNIFVIADTILTARWYGACNKSVHMSLNLSLWQTCLLVHCRMSIEVCTTVEPKWK